MTEPQKAMIKTIAAIVVGAVVLTIALKAEAAPPDRTITTYTYNDSYYQDNGNSGHDDDFDKFMAMSVAGDTCIFDYSPGWQGCVGGGWYDDETALNGSLATRVDQFMVRVNLQSDTDFDEQAIGIGGSWHF